MQLTRKIRVYPTIEQEKVLWALSEKCRLIYNFALAERKEAYLKGEKINYRIQQNGLVLTKKTYPEYSIVYSKVLQMTLNQLDSDYCSFFALRRNGDSTAQPPNFKRRKHFTTMIYNQSGFKVERGCVKLSHNHPSGAPLCFAIPESFAFDKVYQVSVFHDEKDKFYVSVVYEQSEKAYVDNGLYQAFDLGITKHTAVNMHGKFVEFRNPRFDEYWNPIVDALLSRRDHCKKHSRRWKHLHNQWKKCKRKCRRQNRDWMHKLSRRIVENTKANTIVVGDLNVKGMAQSPKASAGLNRSTQNNGFLGCFVRFLTYKAQLEGKRAIGIDEANTSKRCYSCGKEYSMPLWVRVMRCDCGNVLDRDKNSSVNVMLRFLSQNALWTGYQLFVDNLRKTGLPTPKLEVRSQEAPCARLG
jgi:putative transposase